MLNLAKTLRRLRIGTRPAPSLIEMAWRFIPLFFSSRPTSVIGELELTRSSNTFWQSKVLQNSDGAGTNRTLKVSIMEEAFLNSVHVGSFFQKLFGHISIKTWMLLKLLSIKSCNN